MRQAGRYLPEYRALKQRYDFLTLAKTPELAAEVTLQPLRRFPLDAAIIFSDILIIPEALGQPYHFRDSGGIGMDFPIRNAAAIRNLNPNRVMDRLAYLPDAIRIVHNEVGHSHAVLGFGGAPWTLATYMIEGGSSKDFAHTKALFFNEPALFDALLEHITTALIDCFNAQIAAGVDAIQIFDSWGAAAPGAHYQQCSLQWIQRIIESLNPAVPVILFAKGMAHHADALCATGASFLAADPSVNLPALRQSVPAHVGLQGNLDPVLMTLPPAIAANATRAILQSMFPFQRFIFNLGHGITPDAQIDSVHAVLDTLIHFQPDHA